MKQKDSARHLAPVSRRLFRANCRAKPILTRLWPRILHPPAPWRRPRATLKRACPTLALFAAQRPAVVSLLRTCDVVLEAEPAYRRQKTDSSMSELDQTRPQTRHRVADLFGNRLLFIKRC